MGAFSSSFGHCKPFALCPQPNLSLCSRISARPSWRSTNNPLISLTGPVSSAEGGSLFSSPGTYRDTGIEEGGSRTRRLQMAREHGKWRGRVLLSSNFQIWVIRQGDGDKQRSNHLSIRRALSSIRESERAWGIRESGHGPQIKPGIEKENILRDRIKGTRNVRERRCRSSGNQRSIRLNCCISVVFHSKFKSSRELQSAIEVWFRSRENDHCYRPTGWKERGRTSWEIESKGGGVRGRVG